MTWELIDKPARIGRVRGLDKPFSRQTKSLSLSGWKNGLCGLSYLRRGRVFVAEGEKDYLAIAGSDMYNSGVFATTALLEPKHFKLLRDKDVVVFAQADEPGIIGAQNWVTELPESTKIFIPDTVGKDWADVLNTRNPAQAKEILQEFKPLTRKQFLSIDTARYPLPPKQEIYHPNLDVPFMLQIHEAVRQLKSRTSYGYFSFE
tara:strand:+ start:6274 stop:6885 length:612 start_codon:yes stop_codon:yes gene_type:complete